jgi:hypothetical protein
MPRLKKDLDIRSFYDEVQELFGLTMISNLKRQDIDTILTSIQNDVQSFLEWIRNDLKQRPSSDHIYNPLFLLKLWDLSIKESTNYLENRDKDECALHYHQYGLEYLMWMLSLTSLSWMIENLKGKTEVGSCHTHRENTQKPCSLSSQFHKELYDDYIYTIKRVLNHGEANPPIVVG